jgi:hypothetical protein
MRITPHEKNLPAARSSEHRRYIIMEDNYSNRVDAVAPESKTLHLPL